MYLFAFTKVDQLTSYPAQCPYVTDYLLYNLKLIQI